MGQSKPLWETVGELLGFTYIFDANNKKFLKTLWQRQQQNRSLIQALMPAAENFCFVPPTTSEEVQTKKCGREERVKFDR